MTKRSLLLAACCVVLCGMTASGQSIRDRYVSKAEQDGTIYHTFPCTLFANDAAGDLTFDITYKERQDGRATINFTYEMDGATPADSVRFTAGGTTMHGPVSKFYIEPGKKRWKHRYSFTAELTALGAFFAAAAEPEVTLYAAGQPYVYRVKRSAWKSYAPVGSRIIETIRVNEGH